MKTNTCEKLNINVDRCKGCGYCVHFCPKNVLKMAEDLNSRGVHAVKIEDPENCTSCGICARICPDVCIEVYK